MIGRGLLPAGWIVLWCCLLVSVAGRPAEARVFLMPNGEHSPGELGFLMGGAMTALASGGDAVWFNPAGVVKDPEARLTVSGQVLRTDQVTLGEQRVSSTGGVPPGMTYSSPIGSKRSLPWTAYGIALRTAPSHRFATRFAESRNGNAASLPTVLRTGLDVDGLFSGGFTIDESSEGLGELEVFTPAAALAFAPGEGFRLGVALRLEHVRLAERSLIHRGYSGASGANTLAGYAADDWVLEGRANRMVTSLGVQVELSRGLALGVAVDFPSDTLAGSGRVELARQQSLTVDDGVTITNNSAAYFAGGDNLPFRLESPMVIRVGIAMVSDWFLAELDVALTKAQAPYEVLPVVESRPSSTGPAQTGPWNTSGEPAARWALGLAFLQSDAGSLVLGMAVEDSPVPEDDPLFTSVDLTTVTVGYYRAKDRTSGSIGLVLSQSEAQRATLQDTSSEERLQRPVHWQQAALQFGGSVSF